MNNSKLTYNDVDSYIVTSEHNRYYFTGFHSSFGILLMVDGKGFYITDNRYAEVCKNHFEGTDIEAVIVSKTSEAFDKLKEIVITLGLKRTGFEDNMSVREFEELKTAINVEFVAKGVEIELLRSIKTSEELDKIRLSMAISSNAFTKMLANAKVGMTEKELCAELNYQIYKMGADSLAFETIVASGVNGSKPHAVPSDKKIEKGDLVTLDFGARRDGYCADITRTIAFGKLTERQEMIYNTVLQSQKLGLQNIKAGSVCGEVDGVVREFFKSKGLDQYFVHSLGHGVGVEIHETPRLAPKVDIVLQEGMVVTCEPGLYLPREMGVRIEDTVIVTKNGCENLATCDKELIIIKA
ncbi:MAG: Xaa-Pro peptidase family protein [Clostridia bacterium]